MAGAKFVADLRARASESFDVTVLGDERTAATIASCSRGCSAAIAPPDEIITHTPEWYGEQRITLHRGTAAVAIDREQKTVTTATGERVPYDALVIATGSRAMVPPIPGLDAPHVFVMRTIDDCAKIQAAIAPGMPVVVLGGGLLGLEAASGLRALGAVPDGRAHGADAHGDAARSRRRPLPAREDRSARDRRQDECVRGEGLRR